MQKTILVAGATGYLGGKVVKELSGRNISVRALVRPGSETKQLEQQGVKIFRGDINIKDSLFDAMTGIDGLITTAIGYVPRRKGDSLKTDDTGNRNLADVAVALKIPRFIFTSILTCDKARSVPHFWQKKRTEDYFEQVGLNYIALRPGAFLDQNPSMDFNIKGLKKGNLKVLGSTTAKWTNILTADLAKYLAEAAINNNIPPGSKIDIGMEEPMNAEMLVKYAAEYTGRTIKAGAIPWGVAGTLLSFRGLFNPLMGDMKKMFDYFFTGNYVADTRLQQKYFGEVPSVALSVKRYCRQIGLVQEQVPVK